MIRSFTLLLAGCLLAACSSSPETGGRPEAVVTARNVVFIIIDDLGWKDVGSYGSSFYETPHIDRLARGGMRFTDFYAASPVCSPTRASIMTGKHPARLDLTNWIGGGQKGRLLQASYIRQLPHAERTLGELFRDSGYATGYIGKWHLGRKGYLPESQGFDYTFAVNEAGQPGAYFPPYENPRWSLTNVPDLEGDEPGTYLTDRLTDASCEFVDAHKNEPFFLVLSHYSVHTPLQAPKSLIERYKEKGRSLSPRSDEHYEKEHRSETRLRQDHPTYAAMVETVDNSVGRLMAKLEEHGLDENTLVVFVSDNGGLSTLVRRSFSQATANAPLRSGKGWLYDGGIRIPMIMRLPGRIPADSQQTVPAMTTDLLPTVTALAGLPTMTEDGLNLVPFLELRHKVPNRQSLFWHFPHYHGSGNRPGGAVRNGDLKLIEWFETGDVELYDLSADIGERRDLSEERPADTRRLLEELHAWRRSIGANMPSKNPAWKKKDDSWQ